MYTFIKKNHFYSSKEYVKNLIFPRFFSTESGPFQMCGKFKIAKTKNVQYQNSNLIFALRRLIQFEMMLPRIILCAAVASFTYLSYLLREYVPQPPYFIRCSAAIAVPFAAAASSILSSVILFPFCILLHFTRLLMYYSRVRNT